METLGSVASVIASIRDEAAAEAEKLERDVPAIVRESVVIADRDARIAAAHRANRERIAQQEWQLRRAMIEQREAWMERVLTEAHRRWPAMDEQSLVALAREALERIPGPTCQLAVRDDHMDLARSIKQPGKEITVTRGNIAGGCVVVSGGVAFDNSFEARERRLEPEWRRALNALYRT